MSKSLNPRVKICIYTRLNRLLSMKHNRTFSTGYLCVQKAPYLQCTRSDRGTANNWATNRLAHNTYTRRLRSWARTGSVSTSAGCPAHCVTEHGQIGQGRGSILTKSCNYTTSISVHWQCDLLTTTHVSPSWEVK